MAKRVVIIEPNNKFNQENANGEKVKKRVAAYARVSTDELDQLNSYQNQINEYTKRITENPEWEFAGMFADEGISGTSLKKRTEFNKMIDSARKGKIDLIITKSISRFSRNTIDCISIIRELRNINVEIYFEKENLYSSDTKVDFLLTIMSSIAQEEARNISENVKWSVRKRFKEGKVLINTSRFLGYDKDENGNIVINEEQAKTVKLIYTLYLDGMTPKQIMNILIKEGFKNGIGTTDWKVQNIRDILSNEKYTGDAILQKRVVIDYLTHKSVENNGIVPKYHVVDNHPAIISREAFDIVQQMKLKIKQSSWGDERDNNTFDIRYPFTGIFYCSECKRPFIRKHWRSTIKLTCDHVEGRNNCSMRAIDYNALVKASNKVMKELLYGNNDLTKNILSTFKEGLLNFKSTSKLEKCRELLVTKEEEIRNLIKTKLSSGFDDEYFTNEYLQLKEEITSLKSEIETLQNNETESVSLKRKYEDILKIVEHKIDDILMDSRVFKSTINKMIAINNEEIIYCINKSVKYSCSDFPNIIDNLIKKSPIHLGYYEDDDYRFRYRVIFIEKGDLNGND